MALASECIPREWDRGTASLSRLEKKIRTAAYFEELLASRWSGERETSLGLVKDASWRGKRIVAQAA